MYLLRTLLIFSAKVLNEEYLCNKINFYSNYHFKLLSGDTSGQSDPLLSSQEDDSSSVVLNSLDDENITVINGPDTPLLIDYQVNYSLLPNLP